MDRTADLISTPLTADIVRGALELEQTARGVLPHRLPASARRYADGQLAMAEAQPSGVRLAFRTRATQIRLETVPTKQVYPGAPPRPDGVYDLVVDGTGTGAGHRDGRRHPDHRPGNRCGRHHARRASGPRVRRPVRTTRRRSRSGCRGTRRTELVALRTDATVEPAARRRTSALWLHHGSSISHGSNAEQPHVHLAGARGVASAASTWSTSGSAAAPCSTPSSRGSSATPRADLISLKIGINLVNTDVMRRARVRAGRPRLPRHDPRRHPDTPLLVVSPIACRIHEDRPGPTEMDLAGLAEGRLRFRAIGDPAEIAAGRLTLQVIREELADIVEMRSADDPHLGHLDGLQLYGASDAAERPLPDDLHPDAATQRSIGERFARRAFGDDGFFGSGR